jgi:hypothetical protein
MKHVSLAAAALLLAATTAGAQQPAAGAADIPQMKCEPKPTVPGQRMMEDPGIRRRVEREMKTYGDCVKAYVAERQAAAKSLQEAAKANADAGNTAVNEYNAFVKQMNDKASGN